MPSNGINSNGTCMNVDNHLGAKASSRVLAPPGGKSSVSFGGDEAPPAKRPAAPQATEEKENQQQEEVAPAKRQDNQQQDDAPPAKRRAMPEVTEDKENQQQEAGVFNAQPESVQKRGKSAMTSNTGTQNQGNSIGDRPTTRVVNPPGGRSSIVF
eukprot:Hpha_TRINITY_DN15856_c0_g3::TRINITY_DN15856_c0_g3_i2::g.189950::m.189950